MFVRTYAYTVSVDVCCKHMTSDTKETNTEKINKLPPFGSHSGAYPDIRTAPSAEGLKFMIPLLPLNNFNVCLQLTY